MTTDSKAGGGWLSFLLLIVFHYYYIYIELCFEDVLLLGRWGSSYYSVNPSR